MKNLQKFGLLVLITLIWTIPAYSQKSKLVGTWIITKDTSERVGTIKFTNSGSSGVFDETVPVSNISYNNQKFRFNVFSKKLKFKNLTLNTQGVLSGIMIDGNGEKPNREFFVTLRKM